MVFPWSAGDCGAVFQAHQFGKQFGAWNHRDFQAVRFDHFDIVRTSGRGYDHYMGAFDVFRVMPFENICAKISQARRGGRRLQVRAGDGVAARQQDFGDAAHPAAPDADQMDALVGR